MSDDNEPYISAAATEGRVTVDVDMSLNTDEIADEVEKLGIELIEAAKKIRNI